MFYPIKLKLRRIIRYFKQIINYQSFDSHKYSREITEMFPYLTKTLSLALSQTLFKQVFF